MAIKQQPIPGVTGRPYDGCVLFAPTSNQGPWYTYLIDKNDNIINQWEVPASPSSAPYLLSNGNMVYPCKQYELVLNYAAGVGGRILIYDWNKDGNGNDIVLWDWQAPQDFGYQLHHDIDPLPNGNILAIAVEEHSNGDQINGQHQIDSSDVILEIKPNSMDGAEIVWEWHVIDHLDHEGGYDPYKFDKERSFGNNNTIDWNHFNVVYLTELDKIAISSRKWDEIYLIEWRGGEDESGDILYRWGSPQKYGFSEVDDQLNDNHGVNQIKYGYPGEGNIIIFNNNYPIAGEQSSIVEIKPPMDSNGNYIIQEGQPFGPTNPTWGYTSLDLYASKQSGVFRLENGNTFITQASQPGRMLEVNPNGHIVWEYIDPDDKGILRAHQYSRNYIDNIMTNFRSIQKGGRTKPTTRGGG